jgi:cyclopropane-fatty-acyl-phospholipid synthase
MSSFDQSASAFARDLPRGRRGKLLRRLFGNLRYGRVRIELPDGRALDWRGAEPGPDAHLALRRWRALWRAALGGDIGMAAAYLDGDWSSDDLTALIRLAARNLAHSQRMIDGSPLFAILQRLRHALRANTRAGSRRNIEQHYDLGNDFFAAWLDADMIYSSALWTDENFSLEQAQAAKLRRVTQLLRLDGGESVLEIGCGWGALATHLAGAGARVTGLTLSPSQLDAARTRAARLGLAERCDLRLQDYREATGAYDRLVSIEMIEAVGETFLPRYFDAIFRALKPGGVAALQAITIAEDRFESYRRDTDFIQKHIFPGGFLPSKSIMAAQVARAGLKLAHAETFGFSYARTLAEWRRRFQEAWPAIEAQGFAPRFRRLWNYYLCYCEAGFLEEAIDVGLYVIERP